MTTIGHQRRSWFGAVPALPLILQTESSECALACLAMIAGYHGYVADMTTLRARVSVSSRGVDIKSVIDMAEQLQLNSRPLRLEPDEIGELSLPCMLHWGMDHFVVLKRVTAKAIFIHDPAVGERRLTSKEFNRYFTGIALELVPTTDFTEAMVKRRLRLRDLGSGMTGIKRAGFMVLSLSFLLQLFSIATPLYLQLAVDEVVMKNNVELLTGLVLAFAALMFIQVVTTSLRQYVLLYLQYRMNIQMGANLFRHLIRLPMEYFIRRHVGDITSRFGSLEQVRQVLTTGIITALVDGAMTILMLIAMSCYSVKLTAIVVVTTVTYVVIRMLLFKPFRLLTQEGIVAHANVNTHFLESVRAAQTIKLFQKENDRLAQWQNRLAGALEKEIRIASWHVNYGSINALLFGIENLVVIYLAVGAVNAGSLSLGMLYAFISYKLLFMSAMDNLVSQWFEFRMIEVHLERLGDIVFTPTETSITAAQTPIPDSERDELSQPLSGAIEVRNLGFRYSEQDPFIFRHLNFTINVGEVVAIIGPSGCGKTTLLKCLLGLLTPVEGQILIDGIDIRQLPQYRQQIAAVMQEDQLLSGSIRDNIACFATDIDMDKVLLSARMACIESEIIAMPMSFNTLVGDLGTTLSGGQKQRILLARAIYREPRILYMDEATSHLDVEIESRLNHNVGSLNITRVVVAHRPETIKSADRQIALFDGELVHAG